MKTLELSAALFEKYAGLGEIDNYYGLLALFALAQTAREAKDNTLTETCVNMLGMYPDKIQHPYYNFANYKIGGAGKAWMAYTGFFKNQKESIREYAEKTLSAPVSRENILCRPDDIEKNKIWVDTVYAVTPFMLYTGLALNEEKYIDFSAQQCFNMYEFFLDKTCGLVHQSRGYMKNKARVSQDHWSRGNGWMYLGLTELVVSLPHNSKHRRKAEQYFKDLSHTILEYQTPKGIWRQELTSEYAWDESSGSALFLYGLGAGIRLGLLDNNIFEKPYQKGLSALVQNFITDDFSTLMSCEGCLCPEAGDATGSIKAYLTAVHPKTNEPHSYGAFMLALVEAHRNGITYI